jgi:hypothetical protein
MTESHFRVALRAFVQRRPFRPFFIEFLSGDRVRVGHPEAVGERAGVFIYHTARSDYRLFDAGSVCQLLNIVTPLA